MVDAIMTPGVTCWEITSQAPTASIATCMPKRKVRTKAPSRPPTEARRDCASTTGVCSCIQRSTTDCVMPMPVTTSALRVAESTKRVACRERIMTSSVGARVSLSLRRTRPNSASAATLAVMPSKGWKRKITSR